MRKKIAEIFSEIRMGVVSLEEAEDKINNLFSSNSITNCKWCGKPKKNAQSLCANCCRFNPIEFKNLEMPALLVANDYYPNAPKQHERAIQIIGSGMSIDKDWFKKENLKLTSSLLIGKDENKKNKKRGSNITPPKKKRKKG